MAALRQMDYVQIAEIPRLPEQSKWAATDERVELILYTCPCNMTSFIEAEAVWAMVEGQSGTTGHRRLIYSAYLDQANTQQFLSTYTQVPAVSASIETLECRRQRKEEIREEAKATARGIIKTKRPLLIFLGIVLLLVSAHSSYRAVTYYQLVKYPIASGTIVSYRTSGWGLDSRVDIRMSDGTAIYALTGSEYKDSVGSTVSFHYTGLPGSEVLLSGEDNPLYIAFVILGFVLICLLLLFSGRERKAT